MGFDELGIREFFSVEVVKGFVCYRVLYCLNSNLMG